MIDDKDKLEAHEPGEVLIMNKDGVWEWRDMGGRADKRASWIAILVAAVALGVIVVLAIYYL